MPGVLGNLETNDKSKKSLTRRSLETLHEDQCFELEIVQCVERALSNFGERAPSTVFANLLWIGGISKEEIPWRPDKFERCLDIIFRQASPRVKQAIFDEIKSKFGISDYSPNLRDVLAKAHPGF